MDDQRPRWPETLRPARSQRVVHHEVWVTWQQRCDRHPSNLVLNRPTPCHHRAVDSSPETGFNDLSPGNHAQFEIHRRQMGWHGRSSPVSQLFAPPVRSTTSKRLNDRPRISINLGPRHWVAPHQPRVPVFAGRFRQADAGQDAAHGMGHEYALSGRRNPAMARGQDGAGQIDDRFLGPRG